MFIYERGIIKGIEKKSKAIREADLCSSILSKEKSTQREIRKNRMQAGLHSTSSGRKK